jgi:predicted metal-dependent HD superfamily phosphohydrolase
MYDLDRLAKKWQKYWHSLALDSVAIERVFQQLVNAYIQPDRHYHNLNHIQQVLTTVDRFSATLQNPIAVHLAAWFHDFIYDAQASDNEVQSARAAEELLTVIGADKDLIDRVRIIILATQGHQIDPDDPDRCIFLDADLAILGATPVQYLAYHRSIRREYNWVSDAAYQAGRVRVLESFLQRDRLYHTDLLFNQLESIARNNIKTEILQLTTTNSSD